MKRLIYALIVLAAIFGVYKLFISTTSTQITLHESIGDITGGNQYVIVLKGIFGGGNGTVGTAETIRVGSDTFLRFENDFATANCPDVFIYLGENGNYDQAAQPIALLKGNKGSQNYPVRTVTTSYNSVVLRCRASQEDIGTAMLYPPPSQ